MNNEEKPEYLDRHEAFIKEPTSEELKEIISKSENLKALGKLEK